MMVASMFSTDAALSMLVARVLEVADVLGHRVPARAREEQAAHPETLRRKNI